MHKHIEENHPEKTGPGPEQASNDQSGRKAIPRLLSYQPTPAQQDRNIFGEVFGDILHALVVVICDEKSHIRECIALSPEEAGKSLSSWKGKELFSLIDDAQLSRQLYQQFRQNKHLEAHHVPFQGNRGKAFTASLILHARDKQHVGLLLLESKIMDLLDEWGIAHAFQTLSYMHSGLAHHLKNLLLPLNLYLSDINNLDEEDLQIVHLTLSKMNRLIHTFLSFTEPWKESGKSRTNVSELLEEILFILSAKLEDHQLSVKKEIAPNIYSPISAQVFEIISFNLLINAIEASAPKKELTITLGCEDPQELCLTIADQGHGIPREIQDKVFTPFFTTKSTGTGLGLSTVYRLVNDCGGSLELQSSPKGTRISIKLPAIPEPKSLTETLE